MITAKCFLTLHLTKTLLSGLKMVLYIFLRLSPPSSYMCIRRGKAANMQKKVKTIIKGLSFVDFGTQPNGKPK